MQITVKRTRNYNKDQRKSENLFADMKAELKAMNGKMNNAEELISDVDNRIMEIP